MLRRFANDDRGQIHTMEGVIAGLVMIVTLMYITNSVTLLSPHTEKTTVTKLTLNAQDILLVLSSPDLSSNYSSPLLRDIAAWRGGEADAGNRIEFHPGELSIAHLKNAIDAMLVAKNAIDSPLSQNVSEKNLIFNVALIYYDDTTGQITQRTLISEGEPHYNAISASKVITINKGDVPGTGFSPWRGLSTPKPVEVRLVLWFI